MKRREALKNIGLATGFFVATPTIVSILQSCTSDVKTWTPEFLTIDQGVVLTKLVDVILPKTDNLPSATELNVPQFIDKYINEVFDDESQANAKTAFSKIESLLKPNAETAVNDLKDEDFKALLDKHMLLEDEVDPDREADPESTTPTTSEFLNNLKWMAINGYVTTEKIGENVNVYDPVPSQYFCGDLQELTGGKSYSL
ncbi:Gluconate 2-dehydrogenase subunit 3 family protein [Mesoflavibacter sp. HG96]|uniref:gluconate 2-dehydrogenase subunit 3 family protein n=1 Tax=Mesoflavibacter TaxID=444051 RepID=UPI000D1036E3|nr:MULTISPECIES: gluconate 2-dehydrogenase subunit 3 family protein [Mesoflavibacter]QIJ88427.1 Gluconate 2-dehydrogenase subunit 3 family protein [Mesoflavibacter sp. HG96]QIJ91155.1 Gluconate 2-dehydrogenase subunit 3 family protein [Mesoflavibacter sp. HG37]